MKQPQTFLLLLFTLVTTGAIADMAGGVAELQKEWAIANYNTPEDSQEKEFEKLVVKGRSLVATYPDKAEPKIWLAIILSTDAGVTGGLGALGKVKESRDLLEQAEKIDATALDGSIYTSLGSLYYQVPGWPIGFGNDDKAEEYLKKALAVNPDGIDPNYFYADFMLEEGKTEKAITYFQKAQAAPPRANRPLADKGRQAEIAAKLAKVKSELGS